MEFSWWMVQNEHISGVLEGMAGRQDSAKAVITRAYVFCPAWWPQNKTSYIVIGFPEKVFKG